MTGHAHIYERLAHNEITYIVNGLGGHSIYEMDDEAHPDSQVRFNGDFGALLVEGMPTMMKLQFVTRSGIVVDAFELHKETNDVSRQPGKRARFGESRLI